MTQRSVLVNTTSKSKGTFNETEEVIKSVGGKFPLMARHEGDSINKSASLNDIVHYHRNMPSTLLCPFIWSDIISTQLMSMPKRKCLVSKIQALEPKHKILDLFIIIYFFFRSLYLIIKHPNFAWWCDEISSSQPQILQSSLFIFHYACN